MNELDESGVTAREAEVFWALQHRPTNAELSELLYISRRTVESHVSALLTKLGASDRLELSEMARAWSETVSSSLPGALGVLVDPSSFFGRDNELEWLIEGWRSAKTGRPLARLVLGEAGIGKSRLVAEFVDQVRADGGDVWYGACFADIGEPFHPLADVLAERSSRRDRVTTSSTVTPHPEAAVDDAHGAWSIDPAGAVAQAASRILSQLIDAVDGPTVLVVEDVHWARESTRTVIRRLAREAHSVPLLVVATSRDTPPDLDASLSSFLGELSSSPGAETLRLEGLSAAAVEQMIRSINGHADSGAVAEETGGNPLLVQERLHFGRRSGPLRDMLDRRYRLVDRADLDVLELAAVLGDEFSVTLLASGAKQPVGSVIDALGRLDAAGLVIPVPGRAGTYRFVHALFRTFTYDQLPARRRLDLHNRLAETLDDHPGTIDSLARHACSAAPLGDPVNAALLALRAGDRISSMHDPGSAGTRYRWGLDALDTIDHPPDLLLLRLRIRHARTLALQHDSSARPVLVSAARRARDLDELPLMIDAICAMVPTPGGASTPGRIDEMYIDLAEQALARTDATPSRHRVRIMAALGVDLRLSTDQAQRGIELLDQAVSDAEQLDDDITLGLAMLSWQYRGFGPVDLPQALDRARQLRAVGHRTGELVLVITGRLLAGRCHLLRGDIAAVAEELRLCPSGGAPFIQLSAAAQDVVVVALGGDTPRARQRLDELEVAAQAYGSTGMDRIFAPMDLIVRFWEGRTDGQEARISALRSGLTALVPSLDGATAVIAACAGRHAEAGEILDRYVGDNTDHGWQSDYLAALATAHFSYAAILGDRRDLANSLLRLLDEFAEHLVGTGTFVLMSADGLRADLLRMLGRLDEAVDTAKRATNASRRHHTELLLGYELVVLADAMRAAEIKNGIAETVAEAASLAQSTGGRRIRLELDRRQLR